MILTYGDLARAKRHYLHKPGGAAVDMARTQTTPDGWRSFADCHKDGRRTPGNGGLGIAFAHSGAGADGGEIAFIDCDYKPTGADGDTDEKRRWFARKGRSFAALFNPPATAIPVSRSGRGRHLIGRILDADRAAFAATLALLGKWTVDCELDGGVKIEGWNWDGGGRARFLTGNWLGERPDADANLPILRHSAFVEHPDIAALIADKTARAHPAAASRFANRPSAARTGGAGRSFEAMIQPYLSAGADAVAGALAAKGLAADYRSGGEVRFAAADIGCHSSSGTNDLGVSIEDRGGVTVAVCYSHEDDNERTWRAIHDVLGWLPDGQKACANCGNPHREYSNGRRNETCWECWDKAGRPSARREYDPDERLVQCADCGDWRRAFAMDWHKANECREANKEANGGDEQHVVTQGANSGSPQRSEGGAEVGGVKDVDHARIGGADAGGADGRGGGGQGEGESHESRAAANGAGGEADELGAADLARMLDDLNGGAGYTPAAGYSRDDMGADAGGGAGIERESPATSLVRNCHTHGRLGGSNSECLDGGRKCVVTLVEREKGGYWTNPLSKPKADDTGGVGARQAISRWSCFDHNQSGLGKGGCADCERGESARRAIFTPDPDGAGYLPSVSVGEGVKIEPFGDGEVWVEREVWVGVERESPATADGADVSDDDMADAWAAIDSARSDGGGFTADFGAGLTRCPDWCGRWIYANRLIGHRVKKKCEGGVATADEARAWAARLASVGADFLSPVGGERDNLPIPRLTGWRRGAFLRRNPQAHE